MPWASGDSLNSVNLNRRDSHWLSVTDPSYSADTTGAATSDASINAAIAALGARGGTVYLPAGIYSMATGSQLSFGSGNIRLVGDGYFSILSATRSSDTAAISMDTAHCGVANLRVIGNRVAGGTAVGIRGYQTTDCAIESVWVENSGGAGISLNSVLRGSVRYSMISESGRDGIIATNGGQIDLSHNRCYRTSVGLTNGDGAIKITSAVSNAVIMGNSCVSCLRGGIKVTRSGSDIPRDVVVMGNLIDENGESEALSCSGERVTIAGNVLKRSYANGILLSRGSDIVCSGNVIYRSSVGSPANHNAIGLSPQANALTRVVVVGNIGMDDGAGTATQVRCVAFAVSSGSLTEVVVANNIGSGNLQPEAVSVTTEVAGAVWVSDNMGNGTRYPPEFVTFADGDTTPSVKNGTVFRTANTVASRTTITWFDDGVAGQEIAVLLSDTLTDVASGASIRVAGAAAFSGTTNDVVRFVKQGQTWYEISRSVN